ncbi:MAG: ammonium transporter [Deltaproteobacteria bacterium]|nr:ammonium transporter [Deltaproteobacteria bacterium]
MSRKIGPILLLIMLLAPLTALADQAAAQPHVDTGDTAWVLISTALVLLMTAPGLALFYAGMVRRKNVLGTIMQSFVILCVISIQWVLWGYSVSFGPDKWGGLTGGLEWIGLSGVGASPYADYAPTIPHQTFMLFQMMFAVITPALIAGAFAERMKFSAFLVFTILWTTIVYDPIAHWVWGMGGWLRNLGALDFAGGTVVHISSGVSALATALFIGKRKGYLTDSMAPHNLPLTVIGAGLLWFGWFGFNAGSALGANGLASSTFLATNTAAAAAALSWMVAEWAHRGKPTLLGLASGLVAGLVSITPASGFVGPVSALVLGLAAGVICYISVSFIKPLFGYDDSLDAFGIHGVGGIWGALATGLFATVAVNSAGANGLFFGDSALLWKQAVAIAASATYSFVLTLIILKVVDATIGLRVAHEDEVMGLDLTQHSESGYTL